MHDVPAIPLSTSTRCSCSQNRRQAKNAKSAANSNNLGRLFDVTSERRYRNVTIDNLYSPQMVAEQSIIVALLFLLRLHQFAGIFAKKISSAVSQLPACSA